MQIKIFKQTEEGELNKFLEETEALQINYQPDYIVVLYEDKPFLQQKLREAKNNLMNDRIQLRVWKAKRDQKRGGAEAQEEYSNRVLQMERKIEDDELVIEKINELLAG